MVIPVGPNTAQLWTRPDLHASARKCIDLTSEFFMKKTISFSASIFLCSGFGQPAWAQLARDVVPDELTAIEIAQPILKAYFGERKLAELMMGEQFVAELNNDVWTVFPYPSETRPNSTRRRSDRAPDYVVVTGGGRPTIEISKYDAKVISITIAR